MLTKLKSITRTKKILISVAIVCVFVLIGVLVYNNSRYSDKYLEKIEAEIKDKLYTEIVSNPDVKGSFGVVINYQERVVKVQLSVKDSNNEEIKDWLEKNYGKAVSISEGYFNDLIPEDE